MRRSDRCTNCGRSDWVLCADNFGAAYMGCAHCVVQVPPPSPTSRAAQSNGTVTKEKNDADR